MSAEIASSYRVQPGTPGALSEAELRRLQLQLLNETLAWACSHSNFHAHRLPARPLESLDRLTELPFMDETMLVQEYSSLVCTEQDGVSRIVTAPTSGTMGVPKRIAFSEAEQAAIVSYLASGMRMLASPGEAIAVLFPAERTGSLGQLICEGVNQAQARALPYGLPTTERGFADLAQACIEQQVRGMVGFPQHIHAFSLWTKAQGLKMPLSRVLLSADTVSPQLKRRIEDNWGVEVFAHYGTTEMGYGGAVECSCHAGQHIRETDVLFEVIDPMTGEALPPGGWGELVFTTLNRKTMPLIRYRTGDITRLLPGVCACGSVLKRIDDVKGRRDVQLSFSMYDLEELLFAEQGIMDFSASWDAERHVLQVTLQILQGFVPDTSALTQALQHYLSVEVRMSTLTTSDFMPLYNGKRRINLTT